MKTIILLKICAGTSAGCAWPRTSEEMDGTLPRIASFKTHSRGGSYYIPGLNGGLFFGP